MGKNKILETMLVITTGFIVIGLLTGYSVIYKIAVLTGVIGLFFDSVSAWITIGWFKLSEGLGWVMSKVILTVIFYLVLFPISVFFRATSNDNLQLEKKKDSYFITRNHLYTSENLKNIW